MLVRVLHGTLRSFRCHHPAPFQVLPSRYPWSINSPFQWISPGSRRSEPCLQRPQKSNPVGNRSPPSPSHYPVVPTTDFHDLNLFEIITAFQSARMHVVVHGLVLRREICHAYQPIKPLSRVGQKLSCPTFLRIAKLSALSYETQISEIDARA